MKITQPTFIQSEKKLSSGLAKQLSGRRFVILTDEHVNTFCVPRLSEFLSDYSPLDIIEVESGEAAKAPEVVLQLWSHLIDLSVTKSDVLVCMGGGSITDLGGFVGATYKRGIPTIFIPTTLLAMTDAALGGKNGIDLGDIKNVIGTIVQPEAVLVFPSFCESLPMQLVKSGVAEVLKHAMIQGGEFWSRVELTANLMDFTRTGILRESARVKMKIVAKDERESGLRKILNFGHSIGHAVESAARNMGKPIEHGIAVAFGMQVELMYARTIGLLEEIDHLKMSARISDIFGSDFAQMPKWSEIESFIAHDKKAGPDGLTVYIPQALGIFKPVKVSQMDKLQHAYNQVAASYCT
jgi:3-dehydroquinate synthase